MQRVEGVYPKGQKEIHKVIMLDGREVECCAEHLWKVVFNNGTTEIKKTEQMADDFVKVQLDGGRKYKYYIPVTQVDFLEQHMPLDPYLVGVLLGDGSLSDSGSIELSLGIAKEHIIDKLTLPEGVTKAVQFVDNKNSYRVKLNGIRNLLDSIGLRNLRSKTKFIPEDYLYSPIKTRERLLQGLIDTDGHINDRGLFEYSTVSEKLKQDFLTLAWSLGKSVYHTIHTRENDNSYSDTPIHRITELKGYKYGIKIVNIVKTGIFTDMQCLKVSNPDNLYITNNFIPTHNTTTATILAQAIITEGLRNITAGADPQQIVNEIQETVKLVVAEIKKTAKPIKTMDETISVATISSNDPQVGKLIGEAIKKVGKDGIITVEEGKTAETVLETVDGFQFDRGYVSPFFITNRERMKVEFGDCMVVCINQHIQTIREISPLLEKLVTEAKPFVLVIEKIDHEPLRLILINNYRGTFKCAITTAPGFGDRRKEELEDIAISVGGTVLSPETVPIDKATLDDVGTAGRVVIDKDTTTITHGGGDKAELKARIKNLRSLIKATESDYDREKLEERLAKLTGGVAVINVGALTEAETRAKKFKIEDALNATKAALDEGIVPGGGLTYVRIAENLRDKSTLGRSILQQALQEPAKQILRNAGYNPDIVLNHILTDKSVGNGFDAKTGDYVDMLEKGIIDPAKTCRAAIENACSIAGLLLTTNCLIIQKHKEAKKDE